MRNKNNKPVTCVAIYRQNNLLYTIKIIEFMKRTDENSIIVLSDFFNTIYQRGIITKLN